MQNGMVECSVCHSKLLSPTSKTISRAYDRHRSDVSSKSRVLNVLLVVGDCILVGLQVTVFSHEPNASNSSAKEKKKKKKNPYPMGKLHMYPMDLKSTSLPFNVFLMARKCF